ncbi:hypothetical protein [Nonomuraea sp. NPDC050202]|uniref:hypothetical protein n=1 Tax=Nonomuraea sp. NPDC050202 TaxID=3155035 RepID=UPI0033DBC57C
MTWRCANYHHLGDKDGLVQAMATDAFERHRGRKRRRHRRHAADLRRGWDLHVKVRVDNSALYELMYGRPTMERTSRLRPTAASPDVITAAARLRDLLPRGPVASLRASEPVASLRASETALLHDWLDVLGTAEPDRQPPSQPRK